MDLEFAKIAEYEGKKAYISAVFLTGVGFSNKWMKKSTNVLCQGKGSIRWSESLPRVPASEQLVANIWHSRGLLRRNKGKCSADIGITLDDETGYICSYCFQW